MSPDKYHGGVPTDYLRRAHVERPPDPGKSGLSEPERFTMQAVHSAYWFLFNLIRVRLGWDRVRRARARRKALTILELRSRTWGLSDLLASLLRPKRGVHGQHWFHDIDTPLLEQVARYCGAVLPGATMMATDNRVPGAVAITNTTGAFQGTVQSPPYQDQETLAMEGVGYGLPGPSGNAATDQANIQVAIAAAQLIGGGTVNLAPGTYQATSTGRSDSTVSAGLTISAATNSSTTVTATVSTTTYLYAGATIVIANASGGTWASAGRMNGTWTIASILSTTQFTFVVTTAPTGSYSANSASISNYWTDASIVAGDLNSYVIGGGTAGNSNPIGMEQGAAEIIKVYAGVGFLTDRSPLSIGGSGTLPNAQAMWIVNPAIVLPHGIRLRGSGGLSTTSFNTGANGSTSTTLIQDSGSGVTILVRGNAGYEARFGLEDLTLWGVAGTPTNPQSSNTMMGLFIGNNAWWVRCVSVDFSFYGICGAATDGNVNTPSFTDCSFQQNGNTANNMLTGGFITHYFWSAASADQNFYGCLWFNNNGIGIGEYVAGSGVGSSSVNIIGCQFASTFTNPTWNSGETGISMLVNGAGGPVLVEGTWSESASVYDMWVNGGQVTCNSVQFYSQEITGANGIAYAINNYGILNLNGCFLSWVTGNTNYSAAVHIQSGAVVNYMGCALQSGGTSWASGPSATQMSGMGTSQGLALNGSNYTNP